MDVKTIKFEASSAAEEHWDGFFECMDEASREIDPGEPLLPRARRKQLVFAGESNPYRRTHRVLLFPAGGAGCAGLAAVFVETPRSPSYENNKHIATMHLLFVPGKYRGKGLGALLLRRVIEELAANEPQVSELFAPVVLGSGRRFMDRLGGTVSLETAENRLYLQDVDWPMVEAWAAEGAGKNPDTAITTVSVIPQADIDDYSAAYTETINQQPLGDTGIDMKYTPEQIRFGEQQNLEYGAVRTTIYTKGADGSISGLTETVYTKEEGHKAAQLLTGVRERYRGRGLGKLLKAAMLLHIRKEYPGVKYITTGNADSNAPMMAINSKLGFKRHLPVRLYKLKIK